MTITESDAKNPRVAIVGAGTLGGPMAARLLAAHFEVDVWSRTPETIAPLVAVGATGHRAVHDAAAQAGVVVTLLPTAQVTETLMFDQPESGLDALQPGATWVQMATIGPAATERIARRVGALRPDVAFIDAPVSGSKGPAESGQLLILASGNEARARSLEPLFGVVGRKTMWLGPVGAGSRMKLILNTWLAFQAEGAAESPSLAARLNVEPSRVVEALDGNALASPYAIAKLQRTVNADYSSDFSLGWALKDLDLVAADAGSDAAPIASDIATRWRALVESGAGGLDVAAAAQGLAARG
jgi:3-hydroxyisobutyrate dehydrogenase